MTDFTIEDDLRFARDLADMAHVIALERFQALDLEVTTKPDRTPVTDADRAVEQALRAAIAEDRPDDAILGEEFGTLGESRRQWIIDPIDGTANFLRGVPIWGTLIALAVDGRPIVGVVGAPALGKRWWAAKGRGAFAHEYGRSGATPRSIHVSSVENLADASISYNNIQGWDGAGRLDALVALTRSVWRARSIGDMWSYMLVAEGALDAAGEWDLKPYDMAALIPIIEEAGGQFSSLGGDDGPWHGSALASNGLIHEEILASISAGD